jgi:L-ascorbate metabolism protein UlaG (beta-lactamase superfamily)
LETLRLRWHGHSCFEIATDELTVVTDPHDGRSLGIVPPKVHADVVLVSHDHFDHTAVRVVEKQGATVVLRDTGGLPDGKFTARAVRTFHDSQHGESRGANTAFVFEVEGVRFCHLGDLGHELTPEQLQEIGPVDVLFVPIGGVFTIDAPAAWRTAKAVRPKVVVPMHYRTGGLSLSINNLQPLLDAVEDKDSIVRVGNEVEFSAADLEDELLVWVFDCER